MLVVHLLSRQVGRLSQLSLNLMRLVIPNFR
jgi:hypothetical protein